MANYKLSNKALQDLSSILEYTFEAWSEIQVVSDNLIDKLPHKKRTTEVAPNFL